MSEQYLKPPTTDGMTVNLDTVEKGEFGHFSSRTSTLNNTPAATPQRSREHSPERRMTGETIQVGLNETSDAKPIRFLDQELDSKWMGGVIVTCFFTSGLIDAVAFNSWNCFVGMQTGNTVFAALGIGGQPAASHNEQYYKSLLAIASFCAGTLFFNFIHRWHTGLASQASGRRRWVFSTSFLLQSLLIVVAATMVQTGIVSNQPFIAGGFSSGSQVVDTDGGAPRYADLAPIAILSFEAAGQVCLSRVLAVIELPTIVLSTLYHDFTADLYGTKQLVKESTSVSNFFFVQFRRQGKRLMSIVALFCGALVGGEMYKSDVGMSGALWFAASLKICITISFAVWKAEKPSKPILPQ